MRLYLFTSEADPQISCFTQDETGYNCPSHYAPWRLSNNGSVLGIGASGLNGIAGRLERDGYYLVTSETFDEHKAVTRSRPGADG